jgi:hypothetical protein
MWVLESGGKWIEKEVNLKITDDPTRAKKYRDERQAAAGLRRMAKQGIKVCISYLSSKRT